MAMCACDPIGRLRVLLALPVLSSIFITRQTLSPPDEAALIRHPSVQLVYLSICVQERGWILGNEGHARLAERWRPSLISRGRQQVNPCPPRDPPLTEPQSECVHF
ncbi:unnamed protein product [Leuciscus chuanchicus]